MAQSLGKAQHPQRRNPNITIPDRESNWGAIFAMDGFPHSQRIHNANSQIRVSDASASAVQPDHGADDAGSVRRRGEGGAQDAGGAEWEEAAHPQVGVGAGGDAQ